MQLSAFLIAAVFAPAMAGQAELVVSLVGLRNHRGTVHACMTRDARHFPDCKRDPMAFRASVSANSPTLTFRGLSAGRYAVSIFHDENNNHRLDTFLGIPREGFGFSRNPAIRFGPPRFDQVSMEVDGAYTRQTIRLQYLL